MIGIGIMFAGFHMCAMILLLRNMLVRYASPSGQIKFEVTDVDFIRPCGVVVFALFYRLLDLW